jgi:hypothetical protein
MMLEGHGYPFDSCPRFQNRVAHKGDPGHFDPYYAQQWLTKRQQEVGHMNDGNGIGPRPAFMAHSARAQALRL